VKVSGAIIAVISQILYCGVLSVIAADFAPPPSRRRQCWRCPAAGGAPQ